MSTLDAEPSFLFVLWRGLSELTESELGHVRTKLLPMIARVALGLEVARRQMEKYEGVRGRTQDHIREGCSLVGLLVSQFSLAVSTPHTIGLAPTGIVSPKLMSDCRLLLGLSEEEVDQLLREMGLPLSS